MRPKQLLHDHYVLVIICQYERPKFVKSCPQTRRQGDTLLELDVPGILSQHPANDQKGLEILKSNDLPHAGELIEAA